MKRSPQRTEFAVTPVKPAARESLGGDLLVSITHMPTSVSIVLSAADARRLAFHIIRQTDGLLPPRKDA